MALAVFPGNFAMAEINALKLPSPPPQAVPSEVQVQRWGEARISLRIAGSAVAPEFRIRDRPRSGSLSDPVRTDELSGEVLYRHTGGEQELEDSFSYSVKSTRGVSAPAKVTIKIVDPPPDFAVPESIDFGELIAGTESEPFLLEIRNRGGGTIEGKIEVTTGWRIERETGYRLGMYDLAIFTLVAAPKSPGATVGSVSFSSHPGYGTKLKVRALPALSVVPPELEMKPSAPGLAREARLTLANAGPNPVAVHLQGDRRLLLPKPFSVAGESRTTITVALPAADVASFSGTIQIEGDGFDFIIPVKASSEGPPLRIDPDRISFGDVQAAATGRAQAMLTNLGETAVEVVLGAQDPVAIEGPTRLLLQPGESKPIAIRWSPARPGNLRSQLDARSPVGDVSAALEGVALPSRNEKPAPESKSQQQPTPAPPTLAAIDSVRVKDRTTREFKVAWNLPKGSEPCRFRLERSQLRVGPGGKGLFEWIPLQNVTYTRNGSTVTAHVTGLSPGQPCTMRIAVIGPGNKTLPSAPFQVQLNPEPRRWSPPWFWLGGLVLVGAASWRAWRAVRNRRQHA
jgi:hypothetical protein